MLRRARRPRTTDDVPMTAIQDIPVTDITTTTVRAACPHDCPDTCSMLVTVDDGRVDEGARQSRPSVHPGRPVREGHRLPQPHLRPGPRPARRCAGRPEGRGSVRADLLGRRARRDRRPLPRDHRRARPRGDPAGTATSARMGMLNGLTVGDPSSTPSARPSPSAPSATAAASPAYIMTLGPTAAVDPEIARALPLHHHLGLQRAVQQPAPLAVHRGGAAARREGRVHRPGAPTARRRRPTGTSRSGPAPTARSRWR